MLNRFRNLSEVEFKFLRTMEWATKLKEWRMAHVIFGDWIEVWWRKVFKWWLHDANEFEKSLKEWLIVAKDFDWNYIKDLNKFEKDKPIKLNVERWDFEKNKFKEREHDLYPKTWTKENIIDAWNDIQINWKNWERTIVKTIKWIEVTWWKYIGKEWINDVLNTWYPYVQK